MSSGVQLDNDEQDRHNGNMEEEEEVAVQVGLGADAIPDALTASVTSDLGILSLDGGDADRGGEASWLFDGGGREAASASASASALASTDWKDFLRDDEEDAVARRKKSLVNKLDELVSRGT